jgi:hypothetical protein
MSTFQAVVLVAFTSDLTPRSFVQLTTDLGIPEDILKRVLHSLVCGKFKLLRKLDDSVFAEKNLIKATDIFVANDLFRYYKYVCLFIF